MMHRGVDFSVDLIGVGIWHWTIHPRQNGTALIGQAGGTRDEAIATCIREIDALLARDSARPPLPSGC